MQKRFESQEELLLDDFDRHSLMDIDANELKVKMCVNQTRRSEQDNLMDNNYLLDLMMEHDLISIPDEEVGDDF